MGSWTNDDHADALTTLTSKIKSDKHEETSDSTITSGTAAFGAWVELIASSAFQTNYLVVGISEENTSNRYDIDIGVGSTGNEVGEIEGIAHHVSLAGNNIIALHIPYHVDIPIGSRIAARTKATNNTDTVDVELHLTGT